MEACNTPAKFEFNKRRRLDAVLFTLIHTHMHTYIHHHKNRINEFRRPQNVQMYKNLKVELFHDCSTFLP